MLVPGACGLERSLVREVTEIGAPLPDAVEELEEALADETPFAMT